MRLISLGTIDAVENGSAIELDQPTADFILIAVCDGWNGTANLASSDSSGGTFTDISGTAITEAVSDRTHIISMSGDNKFIRAEGTVRTAGSIEFFLIAPY